MNTKSNLLSASIAERINKICLSSNIRNVHIPGFFKNRRNSLERFALGSKVYLYSTENTNPKPYWHGKIAIVMRDGIMKVAAINGIDVIRSHSCLFLTKDEMLLTEVLET